MVAFIEQLAIAIRSKQHLEEHLLVTISGMFLPSCEKLLFGLYSAMRYRHLIVRFFSC